MQNNYTTIEQSERLINIGLPICTADCIRNKKTGIVFFVSTNDMNEYLEQYNEYHQKNGEVCWSAGRLIELLFMFCEGLENNEVTVEENGYKQGIVESLVRSYEVVADKLDFSKLNIKIEKKEDKSQKCFIVTHDCYIGTDPYTGKQMGDTDIMTVCSSLEDAQAYINEQIARNMEANIRDLGKEHYTYRVKWPEFFNGRCADVFMDNDGKKWMWEYNIFERTIHNKNKKK